MPVLRCVSIIATSCLVLSCSKGEQAPAPTPEPTSQPYPVAPLADTTLTLEEVARLPKPGTVVPGSLAFTADDKHISFLFSDDGSLTRQLYAVDLASGERSQVVKPGGAGDTEANLSPEEKLERERRRERGLGVTRYAWSKAGTTLLVPMQGALRLQDGLEGELVTLVDKAAKPALSPQLSRDGSKLAFVRDDELHVVDVKGGTPKQLTRGARGTGKSHGLAEYIAQEEMGRYRGYWWAKDGKHIAFTEIDETHIPSYRIMHQGSAATGAIAQEDHGFPFAGAANAKVRLGVVSATGGKTVWMDLGPSDDIYLARAHWMPSGELWAQIENRAQTELKLLRFDPRTGESSTILTEHSDTWINLNSDFRALHSGEGESFVWASERTGYKHLYLYSASGELIRPLTAGEWPVDRLVAVDEEAQKLFFTSGKGDPTQKHLYEVSIAGSEPRQITQSSGMHSVKLSHNHKLFIDSHSSMASAPTVSVRTIETAELVRSIHEEADPRVAKLALTPPELVTLRSSDGATLHAAIYQPPAQFKAPYPTVVSVYGGPHVQRVNSSWGMTVDLRAQYLRSKGFLVFKLDNRGSARRGQAFEGAIKNDMGNLEVRDQADGVRYLVDKGLADAKRVGIYGWSYGGYLAAMALARAPETFQVAVAGAPVTHWDGYDTHYTERYMGTPKSNAKGYLESSVMHHLKGMVGELMLVHGLIDENVHFRHTARLIDALIKAQKNYELLLFPEERHSPRSQDDRVYMERRIHNFLRKHLMGIR